MAIVKMKKTAVIGMDSVREELLSALMELGAVQLTEPDKTMGSAGVESEGQAENDSENRVTALDVEINRTALALETLQKYSTEKSPLFATRRTMKKSEFARILTGKETILAHVDGILQLNDEIHRLKEAENRKKADLAAVRPWLGYDLPLDLSRTQRTCIDLGVIPAAADMEKLMNRVCEGRDAVYLQEVNRDKDLYYLIVITLKEEREEVLNLLKQHGYTPLPFAGFAGTAADSLAQLTEEIEELQRRCVQAEDQVRSLQDLRLDIECLYDQLIMERDQERIKSKLLKTGRTFCLEGWIPESCIEEAQRLFDRCRCCYAFRDPKEDEAVPVLLQNGGAAWPFEGITEMYSLPDYRGVDPTRSLSLFYAMFFGIMLSDAGYGIIIAAACFIILKRFPLEGMTSKMIRMFFYCGLSTIFWGALFGGWFGDFFQVAAQVIFNREITVKPLWFNPTEDPTRLLIWSLVFGVVHIFFGMGIKAVMLIREGKWLDAVCDIFSWYMVIVGLAMWLGGSSISPALSKPGMYMAAAGAALILLTGGRSKKGIGRVIGGLSSLYDITSYLSDILSYARLLALGLATGVIAQVVNLMGSLAGGGAVGTLVLLFAFVIGHTFNLAINALGAFVHSCRLQYIEFFGKFYEDGGEEFAPFRKNTKYVRLINDTDGGKK